MTALTPLALGDGGFVASAEEARAFLAAHPDIETFEIYFTGLSGVPRGKRVRRSELMAIYEFGRLLPSTLLTLDITGQDCLEDDAFLAEGDADRLGRPVPGALSPAPWLGPEMGQLMLGMYELDGRPNMLDPRHILRRVVERFARDGLTPVVACELEFYLLDVERDGAGAPQIPRLALTGERQSILDVYGLKRLEEVADLLRELWSGCDLQKVPLQGAIAEYSPAQFELVLRHRADALAAGDDAVKYKRLVKSVAARHGFAATFMAKPWTACAGSGMHLHVSVNDAAGRNIFASEDPAGTPALRHAIGGMRAALSESLAIFAPNANSYRRFKPQSYAPITANWAINNRTVALRVPAGPALSRHIEHRVAGADANPYLALAAMLAGVHHGLTQKLDPGPPTLGNGYAADKAGLALPTNWHAALDAYDHSGLLKDYLGEEGYGIYGAVKRAELTRFSGMVSAQDHEWCLDNA
jgi:glutamine synthetase